MRFSFEKNLEGYKEVAKDRVEKALTEKEERDLAHELAFKLKRAAYARYSDVNSQMEIYDIQEEKQRIMQSLKERIALLDDPEHVPEQRPGETLVVQDGETLIAKTVDGDVPITKGEAVTDMEWGMYYYFDPTTVDRRTRKRYLIEDAKRAIHERLDEQISLDELSSVKTSNLVRGAYEAREKSGVIKTGVIAERMVKCFLKKLSYDFDVDFDLVEADLFQDVTQKIDFIVRRRRHERGVQVEEREDVENVGIQFTVNIAPKVIEHKKEQIERSKSYLRPDDPIEDIVLVTMPSQNVRPVYDEWAKDKRPGGPDKLWNMDVKEQIFRGVMEGILPPEEIDEQWGKISGR